MVIRSVVLEDAEINLVSDGPWNFENPETKNSKNTFPLGIIDKVALHRGHLIMSHLAWHGWPAFRRGLATNLHRLGVSDKVILRHANVSTTMNIYVKTVSVDAYECDESLGNDLCN